MDNFIKSMDELPLIAKVILAIPMLDIVWGIYRICKSVKKNNTVGIVLGVIFVLLGFLPIAIFDIVYLLLKQESVWWID